MESPRIVKAPKFLPHQTAIVFCLTRLLQVPLGASLLIAVALPAAARPAQTVVPTEASAPALENALRLLTPDLPPIKPLLPDTLPDSSTVRLVIKLGERRVYVYEGDAVKTSYPIAIGRAGWETPTGSFTVSQMLENPGWTNPLTGEQVPPGNDNPLGERWIGFWTDGLNWIGFHGTPNRASVGTAASHGCIRMYNEDVRKLYDLVQVGTPVTVEQ